MAVSMSIASSISLIHCHYSVRMQVRAYNGKLRAVRSPQDCRCGLQMGKWAAIGLLRKCRVRRPSYGLRLCRTTLDRGRGTALRSAGLGVLVTCTHAPDEGAFSLPGHKTPSYVRRKGSSSDREPPGILDFRVPFGRQLQAHAPQAPTSSNNGSVQSTDFTESNNNGRSGANKPFLGQTPWG